MITLSQFISNTEGRYIDIDGAYGSQCWDYSGYYASQVVGCPSFPTGNGQAIGVFDNFLNPLSQYFIKVTNNPNDPNQFPPVGAIVFWTYNHTGVVIASDSRTMTTLEQNGANDPNQDGIADGVVYRITRGYESVAGWFIPKINVKEEVMNRQQAQNLALYIRLAANQTLEKANLNNSYDADHIIADPAYAGALAKAVYIENEIYRYKANHYDEDTKKLSVQITELSKQVTDLQNLPPKEVEVIKEVIKEVPVEKIVTVIKEVPIGFDKLTFGELLSAAFKKLLNIK
jgi:hypothetical protein